MSESQILRPSLWRLTSRRAIQLPVLLAAVTLTCLFALATSASAAISFTGQELLGRPTDTSMTIKVVPDAAIQLYYEYGTSSGAYTDQTAAETAAVSQPNTTVISGLTPNTHYFYRMRYSSDGGATWVNRDEHSFWTQRSAGSSFTFDVTSDAHVNIQLGNQSNWTSTLSRIASDAPDFLIDLGDTVAMDNGSSSVALGDTAAAEQKYKNVLPSFNRVSASSPVFLVPGNHEQQEAWHLQGTLANSLPTMGKNAEKKFFLNPVPGSFYSGDTATRPELSGDHLIQDYYAWTWGDALFVVINPYWTTTTKPYTTTVGGGETDATGSGDRWDWTLGLGQFNWLKSTLQNSTAKYKFVFTHQMIGGNGMSSPFNQVNYGHGGIDSANFCEWGGYNTNGTTWAWNTERSGWGSQPIRQMMEANGVTAFFHGHDHQMAYETANGMVYQAVPSASFSGSFGNYETGDTYTVRNNDGQTSTGQTIWADSTQGPGYLRVTVSRSATTVDFIRYNGTTPAQTYSISAPQFDAELPTITGQPEDVTVDFGGTATVSVAAHVGHGVLSYQWYRNDSDSNSGGDPITGAVDSSYQAPTATVGTSYYYCVVTNTDNGATGEKEVSKASDAAKVQILKATPAVTLWPVASPISAGQPLSASTLSGGAASVPGVFAFTTPDLVPAASADQGVTFTPTDAASYTTVTGSIWVQVTAKLPVTPLDIKGATIAPIATQTYTGAAIEPALTVTLNGATLTAGTDYTAAYGSNVMAGKAGVTITGTGSYAGTATASFVIVPKKSAITKLKAGTKRFTASWKKHSGAGGYQLAYSPRKASGFKKVSTTAAAKTVKKLKSGTRYSVKLRAYVTIDGTRYFGEWSTVKKVLVK